MQDNVNAFIDIFTEPGNPGGPLNGLSFAAKDLYDMAGHVTGCGNPDWAATHAAAQSTAPAVQALLDAGATCFGKSHTDELAYSLMGVNAHYGTPVNTQAPNRVPGGSSSGSVAATAAGLVDIGLGSDTGGSVRMPASFSGVFGLRTTHGRIGLEGVMPLAPSFDTVGWFARDALTLAMAGMAYGMLETADKLEGLGSPRLLVAEDAFKLASAQTVQALQPALQSLQQHLGAGEQVKITNDALSKWRETFQICQGAEVWQCHGDWVTKTNPDFGPGIRQRFDIAASITPQMWDTAQQARAGQRASLRDLLGDDGLLVLPSSPGPAPLRDAEESSLNSFRQAALELLSPAGLAGLPQISIPAGRVDNAPVGLSIIAPAGRDEWLLTLARSLF